MTAATQPPQAQGAKPEPANQDQTGLGLLVVGVVLILAHAVLLLNAFRNFGAEVVSLSLALILVIFGYDLIRKGLDRMGYGSAPKAPQYYYQPYYYGYYYYGPQQQPYYQQPAQGQPQYAQAPQQQGPPGRSGEQNYARLR